MSASIDKGTKSSDAGGSTVGYEGGLPAVEVYNTVSNERGATGEAAELEDKFGYVQAMPRTKTLFNMLMMMLVISSVPFGIGTTFFYSLINGGAMTVFWGWIIMSCISTCIAVSLGEIASAYPVSGGVYYWSFMLSPPHMAPVVSFITGWLSLVGNITVTLTANFGTTQLLLASVSIFNPDYVAAPFHTVLTCWALILILGTFAILGQRYLPHVDTFCIAWILAGILATAITLPLKAAAGRRSASYVFTEYVDSGAGWSYGWSFVMGLVQGAYCLSPTGMLASFSEEVKRPETTIPRAMTYGIMLNGVLGVVFLLPILFTLGDVTTILSSVTGQPVPEMYLEATGSQSAAFGLFFIVLFNGLCCGLACSQVACRNIWAFARDGGIPGSKLFSKVSARHEMPLPAFVLLVVIQFALSCIYFGSTAAFNAFIGVAVVCLGTSYLIPIAMSFFRGRKLISGAPFFKGKLGYFCNIVSIMWYTFAVVLLCFPTTIPVTPVTMNYASVVFIFFSLVSVAYYFTIGRRTFKGPPMNEALAEMR